MRRRKSKDTTASTISRPSALIVGLSPRSRGEAGARPIAPNGCGRDDAAQPPNRGRVMTFAFFRFQELPIGDALCDGEAEIWFDAESDAIDYAAVTRAVDPDLGEAVDVQFSEAEVIAALLQHRRGAIESAIADAEH